MASNLLCRNAEVAAGLLREIVASLLILTILGAVLVYGVSGLLRIVLVLTAGLLSLALVRRRPLT